MPPECSSVAAICSDMKWSKAARWWLPSTVASGESRVISLREFLRCRADLLRPGSCLNDHAPDRHRWPWRQRGRRRARQHPALGVHASGRPSCSILRQLWPSRRPASW
jgi:hypothetical protein